ncbi:MFS transporter [Kutzneria viridogrisea]|uniref:Transmembrane efflux protein n=1 Tax=Kutzneria albida DSM 43870 TaxID=1449976 RepID=W5W2D3_9PSEU|nr:transmembrane efflux protein [Kutzneria albida DSM 43870]
MFSRTYLLHLVATTISMLGTAGANVAAVFTVLYAGGDTTDVASVALASLLPALAFFLIGGVIADRWPRNLVLVGSNSLSALSQGVLAVLVLTGSVRMWHLVFAAAITGLTTAFAMPASQGLLMRGVDREHASRAFALFRLGINLAQIGGAALGGVLVAGIGPGWVLAADAATFAVAALLRLAMRVEGRLRVSGGLGRELAEGWTEFRAHRWLAALVVQFAAISTLSVGAFENVLGPVQANESLGGAAAWGAVLAADAVGMVLGGLVMLRWQPRRPLVGAACAGLLTVLPMLSMAAGMPVVVVCAAALTGGLGVEVFGVNLMTAMSSQVDRERISRVSAYQSLAGFGLTPLGVAATGQLAGLVGTRATLWTGSVLLAALGLAVLALPSVRELRPGTAVRP